MVDKGAAEIGIIHRPNAGPDYLMTFAAFGVQFLDEETGKLLLPKAEMQAALEWFDWNARNGVTPENNTAMSWDEIQSAFKQEKAFIYHQGVWAVPEWQLGDAKGATWPTDEDGYFNKIGWIHAPAPEQGRRAHEPLAPDRLRREPAVADTRSSRRMLVAYRHPALLQHPARGRRSAHTGVS